jgi:hypothetical protein
MGALQGTGSTGTLTIGSTVMNCPAWDITDLTALWHDHNVRGSDRRIPGVNGVRPYRRRLDVTEIPLTIFIVGDVDRFGAPQSNAMNGLAANVQHLMSNVVLPTNTGDGTRSAVLTIPGLANRTASIHVLSLQSQRVVADASVAALMVATLTISIPTGRFA